MCKQSLTVSVKAGIKLKNQLKPRLFGRGFFDVKNILTILQKKYIITVTVTNNYIKGVNL